MKPPESARKLLANTLMEVVARIPESTQRPVAEADARASEVARKAARQAGMLAASLSLPPGWLGWLTVLPEMLGVWRIQAQMVSDIAGLYGKHGTLGKEQMLYCLFKHVSAQLFRDIAVRTGERLVVQSGGAQALQALVLQISGKLLGAAASKSASRWVPIVGAVGVGAYAYYDTVQVAKNAQRLFRG
jgi:hypothetical protein